MPSKIVLAKDKDKSMPIKRKWDLSKLNDPALIQPHFELDSWGRPNKYHEDMDKLVYEYAYGGFKACGHAMPSILGVQAELRISDTTLQNWRKKYPGLDAACNEVHNMQKLIMTEGGVTGAFNAQFTKFLLSSVHGYTEKTENKTTHELVEPVAPAVFKGVGDQENE